MQITVGEVAHWLAGEVVGNPDAQLFSFGRIESASVGELTFLSNPKYESFIYTTEASAVLVDRDFSPKRPLKTTLIKVDKAYDALALLMQKVQDLESESKPRGIHPTAIIDPSATIGENCYIGAYVCVEKGARIGDGALIYPHSYIGAYSSIGANTTLFARVTLYDKCQIGSHCIIHSGAVIGSDGFGFAPTATHYEKIPQIGYVQIADYVEIGANSCIDRAALGATQIGKGVKIDNLVQIAHNCSVGEHTVMAAQSGMAGSSHVGSWCQLGGQAGVAGHIHVGDKSRLGGQTGVLGNVPEKSTLLGSPGMPLGEALRAFALLPHLPEWERRLRKIEKEVAEKSEKTL